MVISKDDTVMSNDEALSGGQLLRDIEEISQALYLHKAPPKSVPVQFKHQSSFGTKASVRDAFQKEKKSSVWGWKPLKALTHIRGHRFNCFFFLHVHSVEGLPSNFNDLILCVNWKRKNEVFKTHPIRVFQGTAEFEETLMHQCSVYVNRNGPQNSAKYEPKLFLLQASVIGAPTLDFGKHWVDLARLLPLTLEELEEEKRTSGKWTTSFKLKGKAKGAVLNVSFGFSILGDNPFDPRHFVKVSDISKGSGQTPTAVSSDRDQSSSSIGLRRIGSVPRKSYNGHHHVSSQSLDMKYLSEVFPSRKSDLARSITFLYQKLDEGKFGNLKEVDGFCENLVPFDSEAVSSGNGFDDSDFIVIDQGVELSVKDDLKLDHGSTECFHKPVIETIDVADIFQEDLTDSSDKEEPNSNHPLDCDNRCESAIESKCEENDVSGKEPAVAESPAVFMASELAEFDTSPNINGCNEEENYMNPEPIYGAGKLVRSLSLDDVTESVADEFLDMLGIRHNPGDMTSDSEPESPRGRLLKQFEMEFCAFENPIPDLDAASEQVEVSGVARTGSGRVACSDDFDLSLVIQEAEKEYNRVAQSLRSRRKAKMLENLETEAIMQRWGLTDKVFQNSPRIASSGFGSPVYFPPEEPSELPALAEGLGPTIQTKSGGFLRSMNSSLFRKAKNGAKLIMQVSNAVVLPAVMGSNVVEILQCWASGGVENMFAQANELMPLEDITGRTIQEVMQETEHSLEVIKRFDQWASLNDFKVRDHSVVLQKNDEGPPLVQNAPNLGLGSITEKVYSDYVSLEDLVPLAVASFEAPSIEGLRIQCGWSDSEAPSSISPQFTENWTSVGQNVTHGGMGSLGVTPLLPLDAKKNDGTAELIKLSISLNEWIRLDAVDIDYENGNEIGGEMLKILAAHRADLFDLGGLHMTRNGEQIKLSGSNSHLFGNNFTLALRLQLRDPFRDFEMVGSSMLALAQVERVCIPQHGDMHNVNRETDVSKKKDDLNEEFVMEGTGTEENHKSISAPVISLFKIAGVHIAGFIVAPNDRKMLINPRQLQSGSRWLLSSGMNRTSKPPFSMSNAITKPSSQLLKKQTCDTLWSISSEAQSAGTRWKDLATLNIHVRNPDIVLPN